MSDELLGALGPALPVLALMGFVLVLWMFWAVRTRARSPRHRRTSPAAIAQKMEEIDKAERVALAPVSESAIDIEKVAEFLDPFDLGAFLDDASALHLAAQQARATGPTAELEEGLYPVALEHSLASGPGLEAVTETGLASAHVAKASGSPAGCGIDVVFTSLTGEVRSGGPQLVETQETWRFGWTTERRTWRVFMVERGWRRALGAPVLRSDAMPPSKVATYQPDFAGRLAAWESESGTQSPDFDALARVACIHWMAAVNEADPARVSEVAYPSFAETVRTSLRRDAWFDHRLEWIDLQIEQVVPCRLLRCSAAVWISVWVSGTQVARLHGPDEGSGPEDEAPAAVTLPWARYLSFRYGDDSAWRLAWVDDDESWVV